MKKSTKGALAAGAAASLLLGGAGSLAYWNTTGTITGSSIQAGDLSLSAASCGSDWALDSAGGSTTYVSGDPLVPGDVLTKTCTYVITAVGKHLVADVTASTPKLSSNFGGKLTAAVTDLSIAGTQVNEITSSDNTKTLSVTVAVTFDGAAGNGTKNLTSTLNDITVTAQQKHA